MNHYLIQGSYAAPSIRAMTQNPHDREAKASTLIASAGGRLLHFFSAMGESDWLVICELPDDTAATAVSMTIGASGAMSETRTVKLMTVEKAMAAMQMAKTLAYSAPTFSDLVMSAAPS